MLERNERFRELRPRLVGRHKCVGVIDLDDAGVGKDLGSALRMFQRKEPVVSGPQQQHGSVVTAQ